MVVVELYDSVTVWEFPGRKTNGPVSCLPFFTFTNANEIACDVKELRCELLPFWVHWEHNNNKRPECFCFLFIEKFPLLNGRVDWSQFETYRNRWTQRARGDLVTRRTVLAKAFSHVIIIYNFKLYIIYLTSVILMLTTFILLI